MKRITVDNYKNISNQIDWTKISGTVKALRDDMEFSMPFYNDDADIKDTVDLWLKKINVEFAKQQTPKPKGRPTKRETTLKNIEKHPPRPKPKRVTKSFLLTLKNFIKFTPLHQIELMVGNNEMHDELIRIDKELGNIPKSETELKGKEKIVYAHYFYGGSDWYILDFDKGRDAFFCYVILNDDVQMSEFGFTSLQELKTSKRIELDFYFTPKPLGEILYKRDPEYFAKPKEKAKKEKPHTKKPKPKPKKNKTHTTKYKTGDYLYWFENDGSLIKEKIYKVGKNSKGQNIYTVVGPKETWQYSEEEIEDAIKKGNMSLNKPPIKYVNFYNDEFRLLRRFYNMLKSAKPVSFRKIQLLFFAFEKAFLQRKVRKTSPNATILNQTNDKIVATYKAVKKDEQNVKFNITDKKYFSELEKYVKGYKTDPAILLMNRYINLQGDNPDIEKVSRLLKSIENALKNKIGKSNRLYNDLVDAKKELTSYVKTKKPFIEPKKQGLTGIKAKKHSKKKPKKQGLTGISKKTVITELAPPVETVYITQTPKTFPKPQSQTMQDGPENTVLPILEKPDVTEPTAAMPQNKSTGNKVGKTVKQILFETPITNEVFKINSAALQKLLGAVEKKPKESVAITIASPEGGGKTHFSYQVAADFATSGYNVAIWSGEEHRDSKLAKDKMRKYFSTEIMDRITVESDTPNGIDSIHKLIEANDVIILDSWAKILELDRRANFDRDFRKKYDGKLFVIIFQLTADGKMRGGSKSAFDGDVILHVKKHDDWKQNYVFASKNRYSQENINEIKLNIFNRMLMPINENNEIIKV